MRGRWLCLLLMVTMVTACPTNNTLLALCECESGDNGIVLDCSNSEASLVKQTLIDNQSQLGLIQQLIMRNASLRALPSDFMRGLYVKRLDLSHNTITTVDESAFAGLENIVQAISLEHNKLTRVPVGAMSGLTSLLQLNLANNSIADLDGRQQMRNVPKLYDLNLGDNRICAMHKATLDAVKHSLQTLNLGGNCFTQVPASSLRGFKQLLALHLHNNQIQQIEPLAFMNLPQLNLVNLAQNQIGSLHKQAFLNVPALRLMYLGDNRISQLSPNQFRHFDKLEMLDLTENRLTAIPSEAFSNMPKLSQLYLGDNRIEMIDADAFANNTFVILMLAGNRLTLIDDHVLKGMGYLQQLSLKHNQIVRITPSAFHEAPALVMLDLSHNRLPDLPPATFIAQLNMFLIDLSHNRLARTPYNAFNQRVVTVVLQENPLCCIERVHMLQNGVGLFVEDSEDLVCGNTPRPRAPSTDSFITQRVTTPATPTNFRPIDDNGAQNINVGQSINTVGGRQPPVFQGPIGDGGFVQDGSFIPETPFNPTLTNTDGLGPPPIHNAPQTVRFTQAPGIPSRLPDQVGQRQPALFPGQPLQPQFSQTTAVPSLPPGIIVASDQQQPLPQWTQPPNYPNYGPVDYLDYGPEPGFNQQGGQPQWVAPQNVVDPNRAPGGQFVNPTPTQWGAVDTNEWIGQPTQPILVESELPDRVHVPTVAPPTTTRVTKKTPPVEGEQFPFQAGKSNKPSATTANATTTIIICLTVVVLVMVIVFVTLCIARHRGGHGESRRIASSSSDASSSAVAARTSAYVAAQAAYAEQQYGSLIRPSVRPSTSASTTGIHKQGTAEPQTNNQHTWIYTPGAYNNNAQHSYFK